MFLGCAVQSCLDCVIREKKFTLTLTLSDVVLNNNAVSKQTRPVEKPNLMLSANAAQAVDNCFCFPITESVTWDMPLDP